MDVDIVIIGAGINGCGIASDAQGRNLKVALVDKGDIASATSNSSTKLIHGGLRYLEHFEFSLVRESLLEQSWLKSYGTYLVEPLKFIIPHNPMRPAWQVRAGLFIYDKLAQRDLPSATSLGQTDLDNLSLYPQPKKAFSYFDYQTDDHRLAVCDTLDAYSRGAQIFLRHEIMSITSNQGRWTTKIKAPAGNLITLNSQLLVNATGPWVKAFQQEYHLPCDEAINLKLSQGSHLITKKLYDEPQAYLLQEDDKRVVFTLPYHGHTLIGTTDHELEEMPQAPMVQLVEKNYLSSVIEKHFNHKIRQEDIVHSFSGVRALLNTSNSASKCSREYKIISGQSTCKAPCLHIVGGKITTWRSLAENVVNKIATYFPKATGAWTKTKLIPGARLNTTAQEIASGLEQSFPQLPKALLMRLARTYGTRSYQIIGNRRTLAHMGKHFGCLLTEREIEFIIDNEWATDFSSLMRRTRLNYYLNTDEIKAIKGIFSKTATYV